MTDIAVAVKEVIGAHLVRDPEEISSAAFISELGADSLDTVEIVMSLEDRFGIEIPDAEVDKIETVENLVALVRRLTFKN